MGTAFINSNEHFRLLTSACMLSRLERSGKSDEKPISILMVHASPSGEKSMATALSGLEHGVVRAKNASEAISALTRHSIDLVLIDLATTETDGLELCRLLRRSSESEFLPIYLIGTANGTGQEVKAIEAGANDFLTHPLRPKAFQARVKASLRQKARIDSLDDSENVLFSLAQSVEERDPELGQHCHRLALVGAEMGLALGLPSDDILALQRGGYLHDIGKVSVPDHILFKPGPLTPAEWETMQTHAERGERICKGMKSLKSVLPIIRHHHERFDGSGYPDRLRGEEIPLLARILQIADIYDALTTTRSYKAAMTPDEALHTIREEAQRGWRDPKLVKTFADILPRVQTFPTAADISHLSLHALATSVERYRGKPAPVKMPQKAKSTNELKLVSGF